MVTVNDEYLVLMGGTGTDEEYLSSCDYLAVSELSAGWRSMTPLLTPQYRAAAVAMQPRGRILLAGGCIAVGNAENIDLYTPDPTANGDWSPQGQWTTVVAQISCMSMPKLAVVLKGTVLLIGESRLCLNFNPQLCSSRP